MILHVKRCMHIKLCTRLTPEKSGALGIRKRKEGETVEKKEAIHLPDIDFVRHCERKFRVNRGIYNTIDEWFYHEGITGITERRASTLEFLEYLHGVNGIKNNGKINFKSHGLASRLQSFLKAKRSRKPDRSEIMSISG